MCECCKGCACRNWIEDEMDVGFHVRGLLLTGEPIEVVEAIF